MLRVTTVDQGITINQSASSEPKAAGIRNIKNSSCRNHLPVIYFSPEYFLSICLSRALFSVRSNCHIVLHFDGSCYLRVGSCAAL